MRSAQCVVRECVVRECAVRECRGRLGHQGGHTFADGQARRQAGGIDAGGVDEPGLVGVAPNQEIRETLGGRMELGSDAAATQAQIGPLKLQVKEQESVNVPQWLSIGAIVIGGLLLVVGFTRK